MSMDRNQKRSDRKTDYRTIEYLELKYETDIQRGLTLRQVRQRQRDHTYYNTKEKKRIWLACLRQECQNSLFFFILYLCAVSVLFQFTQRMKVILFLSGIIFLLFKVEKVVRYSKVLFKQEEIYSQKAVVLRENTFQCVKADHLVKGDILRLKREEQVPCAVISLNPPYKEYEPGEVFVENTGRAIVANSCTTKEKDIEEYERNCAQSTFLQELFIRQEIYFLPDFLKKMIEGEGGPIVAVGFEETYFPCQSQKEKFRRFLHELKKTGVEWFFFTSQDRESAFSIGKQVGIVKEKREVIDKKQFLLLKNVALKKQIRSIRIYCGLSYAEKRQVITMWETQQEPDQTEYLQKQGKLLFMSGLKQSDKEKTTESCVYACCNGGSQMGDVWFGKCWRDTMIKYLNGENLWQKFFRHARKWEKQILESLCIVMFLSILLALYMPKQENMQRIMQAGSLLCAVYIIGREVVQEGFRRWFLRKLNSN